MTRLPLDVCAVSTPRHPGVVLSAPTTLGKPAGGVWASAGVDAPQPSVRATDPAMTNAPPFQILMAGSSSRCSIASRAAPVLGNLTKGAIGGMKGWLGGTRGGLDWRSHRRTARLSTPQNVKRLPTADGVTTDSPNVFNN